MIQRQPRRWAPRRIKIGGTLQLPQPLPPQTVASPVNPLARPPYIGIPPMPPPPNPQGWEKFKLEWTKAWMSFSNEAWKWGNFIKKFVSAVFELLRAALVLLVIAALVYVISEWSGRSIPAYYWDDYAPRNIRFLAAMWSVLKFAGLSFVAVVIADAVPIPPLSIISLLLHNIVHWEGWGIGPFKISFRGLILWGFFYYLLSTLSETLIPIWQAISGGGFVEKGVMAALISIFMTWWMDHDWMKLERVWRTLILVALVMAIMQRFGGDPFLLRTSWSDFR